MSWRNTGPIRSIRSIAGRALRLAKRVAKPPLRVLVLRSRSMLVRVAHRSPWLHARLRRYRYYDHRLRMMFGGGARTPDAPTFDDSAPGKGLPPVWRRTGHNDARKSPLESWFNR